jgi:hypothetical protein
MSVMFCQRRSRSFLRHREMIRSISAGKAVQDETMEFHEDRSMMNWVTTVLQSVLSNVA